MELKIPVLLGTTRIGRQSLKVARFIVHELERYDDLQTEFLDLANYDFPIMEQRLDHTDTPPPGLHEFSGKLVDADGLLIVAPEYKNGYPGALKNALDYLDPGVLRRKPVGIATVSAGGFGGLNCLAQLRLVCLALGGIPMSEKFPVSKVQEAFDDQGVPRDPTLKEKLRPLLDELLWYTEAVVRHRRVTNQDS